MFNTFSVIVIGDSGVGKSSIVKYLIEGKFVKDIPTTLQPDLACKDVELRNKCKVRLQIFDAAGQESNYGSLTRSSCMDKDGALIVYNVTDRKSFDNISKWVEDAENYMPAEKTIFIVGNMIDKEVQRISTLEGKNKAANLHLKYFETSAKEGTNIHDVFHSLAEDIYAMNRKRSGYLHNRQNDDQQHILQPFDDSNEVKFKSDNECCQCCQCC
ncbi:hypothetical protein ACJMK2_029318 [Sinanodonta woodiana]|uniref:Uncharacterized protein n=1 Tax=Sinanodonta woodiana TaxID=1069815 RepID=A0ABD3XDT2_SINWO